MNTQETNLGSRKTNLEYYAGAAWAIFESEHEKAKEIAIETLDRAREIGNIDISCSMCTLLGSLEKKVGHYEKAIDYFKKIIECYKPTNLDDPKLSGTYSNIGSVYCYQGDFTKASEYFFKCLNIGISNNEKVLIASAYNNIGFLFEQQKEYKKSLDYYNLSLEIAKETNNQKAVAYALNNSAKVHISKKEYSKAIECVEEALSIIMEINDNVALGSAYSILGEVYLKLGDYKSAREYLFKGLKIQESSNPTGEAETLKNISTLYLHLKKSENAMAFSEKSLKVAKRIGAKLLIMEAYKNLSDSFLLVDNYKKAYLYLEKYTVMKDELFCTEQTKTIIGLRSKFEADKKNQLIKQLTSLNDELKQFANRAAHDMREPLRVISQFSDMLQMQCKSLDSNPESVEYVRFIKSASIRMQSMLDDLLQYATAGLNTIAIVEIDLDHILAIVQNNLFLNIKESDATINCSDLPMIFATRTGMIQLFQNLIANAIKFQKEGVPPVIDINCDEEKDHFVFHVSDNGIGIEKQFQEKIFGIFNQLHPRDKYVGSGIGLAICKKIIKNMGGEILVNSILGAGATFIVKIPKKPEFILNID